MHIPRRLKFRGDRAWLSGEAPKRGRISQPLVKAVKRAHELLDGIPMRTECCSKRRRGFTNKV